MRLCYVSPGPLVELPDIGLALDAKSASGLQAMAARWPGELVVISGSTRKPVASDLDLTPIASLGDSIDVRVSGDVAKQVSKIGASVILALGRLDNAPLLSLEPPVVFTAETTRSIRTDIALATGSRSVLRRARIIAGAARRERCLRAMYSSAAGLQCNGFAAFAQYSHLTRSVFFHDHRVTTDDINQTARSPRVPKGDRFTAAFSGRMTPIKGAEHALRALNELRALDTVDLIMIGDGEQRPQLEALASSAIRFTGALDYRPHWLDLMRREVDLLLLPHLQGDPSCTYFEALGSGVPVIGYDNETLTPLLNTIPAGEAVQKGDWAALAALAAKCVTNPAPLRRWSDAGLEYMRQHSFEQTITRRVDHLLEVAL